MSDFPVQSKLFYLALALVFLAPILAILLAAAVDQGAPALEFSWASGLTFGAGVLLMLSAIYGRTDAEPTRAPSQPSK